MNRILLLIRVVYWLVLAGLAHALQYQSVDFMAWAISNPDAECLKNGVPYMINVGLFSWAFMLLVWPLAAWNLGGRFLWGRYKSHMQSSASHGAGNA
jgi:hypothetical protein